MAFEWVMDGWWDFTTLEVYCLYAMGYFVAHLANPGSVAQGYQDVTNLEVGTRWTRLYDQMKENRIEPWGGLKADCFK